MSKFGPQNLTYIITLGGQSIDWGYLLLYGVLDGGLKPEPLGVGIPPADLNVEIIEKKIVYKSHTANYNHVIY